MSADRCEVLVGDVIERLSARPAESVHCVVTSPPYWGLRDYGVDGQIGLESTPAEYVARMVEVFREIRRVLRRDGTCWVNLGDTYVGGRSGGIGPKSNITSHRNHHAARAAWKAQGGGTHRSVDGLKPKDMIGVPWRVALALQDDGWWLRSDIIWHKPAPMPENVADRPSRAHEYLFLLAKSESYYFDADAIRTAIRPKTLTSYGTKRRSKGTDALGQIAAHNISASIPDRKPRLDEHGRPMGANIRTVWRLDEVDAPDVWTIASEPYPHSHFATMPSALVRPCVLAGCPIDGVVLDPFAGSGTALEVALELGRRALGIELNPDYLPLIERRLRTVQYPLIIEGSAGQ